MDYFGHTIWDLRSPNVRAPAETTMHLHPGGDAQILGAVVTADATRNPMPIGGLEEEREDGLRAIVCVDTYPGDEP